MYFFVRNVNTEVQPLWITVQGFLKNETTRKNSKIKYISHF